MAMFSNNNKVNVTAAAALDFFVAQFVSSALIYANVVIIINNKQNKKNKFPSVFKFFG